jgi:predicted MPP superfamily phosphohydrolase
MGLVETTLSVPGLPADLNGLRIAQVTDIHYGPYFGRRSLERAVAMANEARPQLTMVTGDLITMRRDPLDDCLALLKRLKADSGVYGCLGNHEIAADCEDYATEAAARIGIKMLRAEQTLLRFGNADLNLAGVDYQRNRPAHLKDALDLVRPGTMNLLLSHNPDVFPTAVSQGWDVTLSGHTHGGQVDVEILGEHLNPARFFTPFIYGRYERGGKLLLVSRGLGTVGAPMRAGAPPEVNLIKLVSA